MAGLKDAETSPEYISAVLLTHNHGDHVRGLLAEDGVFPVFTNATLFISAAELDFWKASRPEQAAAFSSEHRRVSAWSRKSATASAFAKIRQSIVATVLCRRVRFPQLQLDFTATQRRGYNA